MVRKALRIGDIPIERVPLERIKEPKVELSLGLQASMSEDGMLHNVILRPVKCSHKKHGNVEYEVTFGKRRVRAAFANEDKFVDARIVPGTIDKVTMARIVLSENFQRSPNAAVEAEMLKVLQDEGMNQERMAEYLHVTQGQISKRLGLFKLSPPLFLRLKVGSISSSVARELAKLPHEEQGAFQEKPSITLREVREARRLFALSELDFAKLEKTGCDLCGPLLKIRSENTVPDAQKEAVTPGVSCTNHHLLQAFVRDKVDGKRKRINLPYKVCPNCFEKETLEEKESSKNIILTSEPKHPGFGKVTKKSIEEIKGTVWRNKHTHGLAKIGEIVPSPRKGEVEVYDTLEYSGHTQDSGLRCPMAWVHYGEKWSKVMEHWYRVDHLSKKEQIEGYLQRVGYCREQVTETRKKYNAMLNMSKDKRNSCYTGNLKMRERGWKDAKKELIKAEKARDWFSIDGL